MRVWAYVQHELSSMPHNIQAFDIPCDVVDIQQHIENRGYNVQHIQGVEHVNQRRSKRIYRRKTKQLPQQPDGWANLLAAWQSNSPQR